MRLLAALLVIGVSANDAEKYCPSAACWDYVSGVCVMRKHTSGAETGQAICANLECKTTTMQVAFHFDLFGTDWVESDFNEGTYDGNAGGSPVIRNCLGPYVGSYFMWSTNLGECGMSVARKSGDPTKIVFTKELRVTRKNPTSIGSTDIYTSDAMGVVVTFKCEYSTTVELSTDATITTPIDVSGDVTISTGIFDAGLHLKFYTDNGYGTELSTAQTIGTVMHAQVFWDVLTLSTKVGFYLDHCKVEERTGSPGAYTYIKPIFVLEDTCFAHVIEAQPVANTDTNVQYVTNNYRFNYKSFSYSTSGDSVHRLTCQVVFCTHSKSGNTLTVDSDCAGMVESSSTKRKNQGACEAVADDSSYDWTFYAKV